VTEHPPIRAMSVDFRRGYLPRIIPRATCSVDSDPQSASTTVMERAKSCVEGNIEVDDGSEPSIVGARTFSTAAAQDDFPLYSGCASLSVLSWMWHRGRFQVCPKSCHARVASAGFLIR
jgi:hypothetical protein